MRCYADGFCMRRHASQIITLVTLVVATMTAHAPPANAATSRPSMPRHGWLVSATSTSATIRWTPVAGATRYEIRSGGRRIGVVTTTSAIVRRLRPATFSNLQVVAWRGRLASAPSDPIPAVTRASSACTRWVSSSTGSDAGAGTAMSPWRTISRLVANWQPGDVGCVSGSFVEDVSIMRGGASLAAPVTLRSAPGTRAQLRGRLWVARSASYVVVSSMTLDGRAIDDTVRNSLPSPTVNARSTVLIDNDISNARTRVCVVLGSIHGYGTAFLPTLAYNRIHDCGSRGGNTQHGVYVESARSARIVHNVIFDNADRGIQLYPDAQRSLIVGNLIDGNGEGIIFSGAEGYRSSRNLVLRNVIANSQLRSNVEHWWETPRYPGVGNVVARNCLGGAMQGNFALPIAGYVVRGNATGALRFVDRASGDLRLAAGSGCRAWLLSGTLPLAPFPLPSAASRQATSLH